MRRFRRRLSIAASSSATLTTSVTPSTRSRMMRSMPRLQGLRRRPGSRRTHRPADRHDAGRLVDRRVRCRRCRPAAQGGSLRWWLRLVRACRRHSISRARTISTVSSCARSPVRSAHQGGWDEILLVGGPILVIVGLLWLAERNASTPSRCRWPTHPSRASTPSPDHRPVAMSETPAFGLGSSLVLGQRRADSRQRGVERRLRTIRVVTGSRRPARSGQRRTCSRCRCGCVVGGGRRAAGGGRPACPGCTGAIG